MSSSFLTKDEAVERLLAMRCNSLKVKRAKRAYHKHNTKDLSVRQIRDRIDKATTINAIKSVDMFFDPKATHAAKAQKSILLHYVNDLLS